MASWMVDEKDEYEDAGPKIGQYDSPSLLVNSNDSPGSKKPVSKRASKMAIQPENKLKFKDNVAGDNTNKASPKATSPRFELNIKEIDFSKQADLA